MFRNQIFMQDKLIFCQNCTVFLACHGQIFLNLLHKPQFWHSTPMIRSRVIDISSFYFAFISSTTMIRIPCNHHFLNNEGWRGVKGQSQPVGCVAAAVHTFVGEKTRGKHGPDASAKDEVTTIIKWCFFW